ncbi:MAG TPA: flagellar motor switch phosphatase FliY, partial [Desulfobacteria bacterium]|nr:flagellar motor switch phosphatase FliY [Desulfobacteria bacterium]
MSDGVLSQEEIDALLRSSALSELSDESVVEKSPAETADEPVTGISALEQDAVAEVSNIIMGSAVNALSSLLGRSVEITSPVVQTTDTYTFRQEYPHSYLMVNIDYTAGVIGSNVLLLKYNDACLLADLIMSGDGQDPPPELNEIYLSAISEAMNQMMGSASTALSTIIDDPVAISPPSLETVDLASDELSGNFADGQTLVKVTFGLKIDDLFDGEIIQLIPVELSKSIIKNLLDEMKGYETSGAESQMPLSDNGQTSAYESYVEPVTANPEPAVIPISQVAAAAEPSIISPAQETPVFDLKNIIEPAPVKPVSEKQEIPVQPVQFAPLQSNFMA